VVDVQVKQEHFADFEEVWRTRESHLKEMPGFVRFAMLKCEPRDSICAAFGAATGGMSSSGSTCFGGAAAHSLQLITSHHPLLLLPAFPLLNTPGTNVPGKYISQTTWENKAAFENWTQSSQFRASHGEGNSKRPSVGTMLEGPPSPELYESVTVTE
jgi:heme-degrading monooxygenase HmoA